MHITRTRGGAKKLSPRTKQTRKKIADINRADKKILRIQNSIVLNISTHMKQIIPLYQWILMKITQKRNIHIVKYIHH